MPLMSDDYKTGDILHLYKLATDKIKGSDDLDAKINAYDSVVNFCMNSDGCRIDDGTKRKMVMYWSYCNIGEAWADKNREDSAYKFDNQNYITALKYYNAALQTARDDLERVSALSKMASLYKTLDDVSKWVTTREQVIEYMEDDYKRQAYMDLAEEINDDNKSAVIWEKALLYVTKEEVSVLAKCKNTLQVCGILKDIYQRGNNLDKVKKINELIDKTAILAVNALEERIHNENDRAKKLQLYSKLIEVEDKYIKANDAHKRRVFQQLGRILNAEEVLHVNGVKYSRKTIEKMITSN